MSRIILTPERLAKLQATFDRLKPDHPWWPADIGVMLSSPLMLRILSLHADHASPGKSVPSRVPLVGHERQGSALPRSDLPYVWPQVKRHPTIPFLDQKMRAAGEKPDDD